MDGLGSTRALSDESGLATDRYIYDAFGQVLTKIGDTDNSYLYAGEQRDINLGLDYLRARYLDVDTGRFVSRDTFEGFQRTPVTLHKYLYANMNPVNLIDPSGQVASLELLIVISTIGTSIASSIATFNSLQRNAQKLVDEQSDTKPSALPSCPKTEKDLQAERTGTKKPPADDPKSRYQWVTDNAITFRIFHPGAASAYRRRSEGISGQQCSYDRHGKLITAGPAAGTPDLISPEFSKINHFFADVLPGFKPPINADWRKYHAQPQWAPQNARKAPANFVTSETF